MKTARLVLFPGRAPAGYDPIPVDSLLVHWGAFDVEEGAPPSPPVAQGTLMGDDLVSQVLELLGQVAFSVQRSDDYSDFDVLVVNGQEQDGEVLRLGYELTDRGADFLEQFKMPTIQ